MKTTWSFSAFSILVYYAITHLAALRLPDMDRRYPPIVAWGGLAACLFLAFFVPPRIWLAGLALIGLGFAWHLLPRMWRPRLHPVASGSRSDRDNEQSVGMRSGVVVAATLVLSCRLVEAGSDYRRDSLS